MEDQNLNQLLEEVQFACLSGVPPGQVATQLKQLTKAKYPPAQDFLIQCLKNRNEDWRIHALMTLGYEYDPIGNEQILTAIGDFVRQDENPQLRQKGIEILALYANWPEQALIDALQNDPVIAVRFAALRAILEMKGVSRLTVRDEVGMLQARGVMPSLEDVERIARKASGQFRGFFE